MTEKVKTDFNIKINFQYTSTDDNTADYITKGLTIKKIKEKFSFGMRDRNR